MPSADATRRDGSTAKTFPMHVLITAGPTREHLDDVRFLSNASSGRMGYALAESAIGRGWQVSLVSGPVALGPPGTARLFRVVSARQMHEKCIELLPQVDGVIAVAAVADYRPAQRQPGKLAGGSGPLEIEFVPNPDILADMGRKRERQWIVGFAVEASDSLDRPRQKLDRKNCDAIVVNRSSVMEAQDTSIRLLDRTGSVALEFRGAKQQAAEQIIGWIAEHLAGKCS